MGKSKKLIDKVKAIPAVPGVYLMRDKNSEIIYVGKSKNLKNRVPNYFQSPEKLNLKTRKLSENIVDFDLIFTNSEEEALILENELIKKHSPKYNILLKDSKTYPYVKVSSEGGYGNISVVRKRDGKGEYFGPYPNSAAAKEIVSFVTKTFKIASCNKKFEYKKQICRPCLNSHIGQCIAPCSGKISADEYNDIFKEIVMFLKGDYDSTVKAITEKMNICAEELKFESAARCRDRITAINKLAEKQRVLFSSEKEFDVFGLYEDESMSVLAVLFIRNGRIIGKEEMVFTSDWVLDRHILHDFLDRYYCDSENVPANILISFETEDREALEERLSSKRGTKVRILCPERGEKKWLTDMAINNAKEICAHRNAFYQRDEKVLLKLAKLLSLEFVPERIEAYDISNSADKNTYAGMIVVENGRFKKSDYRQFAINTISGTDDYRAMKEAVERRCLYLTEKKENSSFERYPDLILVDGGKGHVSSVREVLKDKGVYIPVFGMVKDEYHKTRTLTDGENEISIAKDPSLFSFIYKIQEEVHRFTFSRMDASRRKSVKRLSLENIDGIGNKKAKSLLLHFKTVTNIKNASVEELMQVNGINRSLAVKIKEYYASKENK